MAIGTHITVADVANALQERRRQGHKTVLFLGSRAGALYQSPSFYDALQKTKHYDPASLAEKDQFAACYHIFKNLSDKAEINTILQQSLQYPKITPGYTALAKLIKQGYFSIILTTNIDNLLEDALSQVEINEACDYSIVTPDQIDSRKNDQENKLRIIKVSGGFPSKNSFLGQEENLRRISKNLRDHLEDLLVKDILLIGYDPVWDQAITSVFPPQIETLSFINEDEPPENSSIFPILQRSEIATTTLIGEMGNYEFFMRLLYWQLQSDQKTTLSLLSIPNKLQDLRDTIETIWNLDIDQEHDPLSLSEEQMPAFNLDQSEEVPGHQPTPVKTNGERNKVFICYSHEDIKYLHRLKTHLDSLGKKSSVEYWDDTKLRAGTYWQREIEYALQTAKVAIILVSPDLLASEFVLKNELPPLLKAAESEGTIILPVILCPCLFQESHLGKFEPINSPFKPLSKLTGSGRDEIWVELVRYILGLLNGQSHSVSPVGHWYQRPSGNR